jgi:hypothetical protein
MTSACSPIRPHSSSVSNLSPSSAPDCTGIRSGSNCRDDIRTGSATRSRRRSKLPLVINFDFEADQLDAEPLDGRIVKGENGASLLVSSDTSRGGTRSLKFTDAPDQRYAWTPHIYYQRTYDDGQIRLSWDMLNSAETPASFFVEVRQMDPGAPYLVGPTVWVAPDGQVTASGQPVGTIPLGQWVTVTVDLRLGEKLPRPIA